MLGAVLCEDRRRIDFADARRATFWCCFRPRKRWASTKEKCWRIRIFPRPARSMTFATRFLSTVRSSSCGDSMYSKSRSRCGRDNGSPHSPPITDFPEQDAIYFSTHEEADMDTHKLGEDGEEAMGHGAFNRTVLTRALQESVEFRAGYSMEYCALTMVDLHAADEAGRARQSVPSLTENTRRRRRSQTDAL